MVGKTVDVDERLWVEAHRGGGRHRRALRPADDRPREVEVRRSGSAAWNDEAAERLQRLVHLVHLPLQAGDLIGGDAKCHLAGREIFAGGGEVGAEIEQLVLDAPEDVSVRVVSDVEKRYSDRAIGFIDVADRRDAQIRLGDSGAVDQAGIALVARASVDFGELDQIRTRRRGRPV